MRITFITILILTLVSLQPHCTEGDVRAGRQRRGGSIEAGDHIRWKKPTYFHHAIVTEVISSSRLRVIHYNGRNKKEGEIIEHIQPRCQDYCPVLEFRCRPYCAALVAKPKYPETPRSVMARARSRLKERKYNAVTNNCEHFANWCMTGDRRSGQAGRGIGYFIGGVATMVVAPGLGLFGGVSIFGGLYYIIHRFKN